MRQQAEKLKNRVPDPTQEEQEKLKMQMDQLRQELGRHWADI